MKKTALGNEQIVADLEAASRRLFRSADVYSCTSCEDAYGQAVDEITHGYCPACFLELSDGTIAPPKNNLVADTLNGFSPDKMNAGIYRW